MRTYLKSIIAGAPVVVLLHGLHYLAKVLDMPVKVLLHVSKL